ncbi:MAG: energy-coupled thiamine transporter ThiT [Lachnospiraceae bacterium]|jgi:thiamine transporter|nr:energy-coupled thiamine transporter ThiT [Lachnospiraceae bacterium]MEE3456882.1 energy-coupled thiamine transporter ThiT [Lachnospiraceae bacterium]
MFYNADGGLTTAGYVLTAVAVFALLILISTLAGKKKTVNAKQLAFAAGALALAIVTSYIKLFHLPMGGSVTLFSMFFVTLIGYWYGPTVGIMAGVAYGLLQMILDPYIISLPQMLIDYPFAFGALGLSGLFSEKKNGMIIGYIVSVFGRFVFAVLSGVIFFGMYAPEGMSPLVYSVSYNGAYLAAEAAITIILLCVPAVKKALATVKTQALN